MPRSSKWPLSHRFPHQNPVWTSLLSHTCQTFHPPHSSSCGHLVSIRWGVQIMKVLLVEFPLVPCYVAPHRPKYLSQHPILKHHQPMFLTYPDLRPFLIGTMSDKWLPTLTPLLVSFRHIFIINISTNLCT
jgi:hypothetical protein